MPPPRTTTSPGRDAGNAAEEDAAAAERLLEEVRPDLDREAARDLAHRREQRQAAVVGLDGLVGDAGDAALDERARQRLVGGDVEVREEDEPLAQAAVLGRDRLLHLEQELRPAPRRPRRRRCARPRARSRRRGTRSRRRRSSRRAPRDPCWTSSRAPAGVSATRYSSVLISLATPIRKAGQTIACEPSVSGIARCEAATDTSHLAPVSSIPSGGRHGPAPLGGARGRGPSGPARHVVTVRRCGAR